jgi:hypothetical protein
MVQPEPIHGCRLAARAREIEIERQRRDQTARPVESLHSLPALVDTYRARGYDDATMTRLLRAADPTLPAETIERVMRKIDKLDAARSIEARDVEIMHLRDAGKKNPEIGRR